LSSPWESYHARAPINRFAAVFHKRRDLSNHVIAGLDPAIQSSWLQRLVPLDARVKPGHDEP